MLCPGAGLLRSGGSARPGRFALSRGGGATFRLCPLALMPVERLSTDLLALGRHASATHPAHLALHCYCIWSFDTAWSFSMIWKYPLWQSGTGWPYRFGNSVPDARFPLRESSHSGRLVPIAHYEQLASVIGTGRIPPCRSHGIGCPFLLLIQ